MANKGNWSSVTTLKGLSTEARKQFSWDNLRHFYRVSLWDISHLCAICGKEISHITKATLDHKIPRSRGGRTRLANLQLAHERCNGTKSNKLLNGLPKNWKQLVRPLRRHT